MEGGAGADGLTLSDMGTMNNGGGQTRDTQPNPEQGGSAVQGWLWSGNCAAVLLAALLFALLYKKRR